MCDIRFYVPRMCRIYELYLRSDDCEVLLDTENLIRTFKEHRHIGDISSLLKQNTSLR
jgi:hypothetical protein